MKKYVAPQLNKLTAGEAKLLLQANGALSDQEVADLLDCVGLSARELQVEFFLYSAADCLRETTDLIELIVPRSVVVSNVPTLH